MSSLEGVIRDMLQLKDSTCKKYDADTKALEVFLEKQELELSEESMSRWIIALKNEGTAPSNINSKLAGVCMVLECRTGNPVRGAKFLKKTSNMWMKKQVVKKSNAFTFGNVFEFVEKIDLSSKQDLIYGTGLILGIYGVHRISEVQAYEARMITADGGGNGLWIDFDGATKTTSLGQVTKKHVCETMVFTDRAVNPARVIRALIKLLREEFVDDYTMHLFMTVRNDKFIRQRIGINTIRRFPRVIASCLGLSTADRFTGHAFRRSAAKIMANLGATSREIQRAGNWKDPKTCEGYIDTSQLSAIYVRLNDGTSSAEKNVVAPVRTSTHVRGLTSSFWFLQYQLMQSGSDKHNS